MVLAVALPVRFFFVSLFVFGVIIANRDSACGWC
jgi:hypothetical protein